MLRSIIGAGKALFSHLGILLGVMGVPGDWKEMQSLFGKAMALIDDPWFRGALTLLCLIAVVVTWSRWIADYRIGRGPRILTAAQRVLDRVRGRPFTWQLNNVLGLSSSNSGSYVSGFYARLIHHKSAPVKVEDAYIESPQRGTRLDMKIDQPQGPYVTTIGGVNVTRGVTTQLHALLYDPSEPREPGQREGITENEFRSLWGEFDLVVTIDGRVFRRTFSPRTIKGMLNEGRV